MKRANQGVTRDIESAAAAPAAMGVSPESAPPRRTRPKSRPAPRRTVKILFVAANTRLGDQLALDEEYRAIERSLRAARYRDAFQLIPLLATRREDLQQALLEHCPDVVHFACHGSPRAEVLLLGDGPNPEAISAEALASLFRVLQDNLALVVFNACFAEGQASAIRQHAGIAIGMRERIEDKVAIAFASALYGTLAYGRSVREAFDLGVAAVEAIEARQKRTPRLFLGAGMDAHAVRLVEPAGEPRLARAARLAALTAAPALALALAWLAWPSPAEPTPGLAAGRQSDEPGVARERGLTLRPLAPGMIRFAAASVRPGVRAASQRAAACTPADRPEGCAEPAHPEQVETVALQAFDLDVVEVTNGDYARWLMASAETWTVTPKGIVKTRGEPGVPLVLASEKCGGGLAIIEGDRVITSPDKASWPVVCVTWHGASEYCLAKHKRLPLEMEWELAARGDGGRPFPWGADLPRQDGVVFDLRDGASAHPRDVGAAMQDVSPEGIRDLGGNVAEWVEDSRGDTGQKTIRGGSWASRGPCHVLGSSCKQMNVSGPYGPDVGFRCASSVMEGH